MKTVGAEPSPQYLLRFHTLTTGLPVMDISDQTLGVIEDCSDIHNVCVNFPSIYPEDDGRGLYCMHEECKDFLPLLYSYEYRYISTSAEKEPNP